MRIRALVPLAIVTAALAVPAASLGGHGQGSGQYKANPSRLCKAQRTEMGVDAFKAAWGTNANKSNALGKCVSAMAKQQTETVSNAEQSCRTEQAADPQGFKDTYGTNKNKSNAFGKCVSQHAKQLTQEEQEATTNVPQTCRDLRNQMGSKLFALTYGTNKNRKNAFGKCVSKSTKTQLGNQSNAAKTCKAEQAADAQAFADKYGTNANKSNAFGKCVSQHAKQKTEDQEQATVNAAHTCKAERASIGTQAFNDKWGTNHNKRNAFGKCVSHYAKQQSS
jgi:hypothetical protein